MANLNPSARRTGEPNCGPESSAAELEELYRRYGASLLKLCERQLGHTEAEDARQEVILRAHLARLREDAPANIRRLWPWLVTIALNYCATLRRKRGREAPPEARPEEVTEDLDVEVEARFRRALVTEGLAAMKGRYGRVLYLCHVEGWSREEIATAEGVSVAAVRNRLLRARRALREEMSANADRKRMWPVPAIVPALWHRLRVAWARAATAAQGSLAEVSSRFGVDTVEALAAQPLANASIAVLLTVGALGAQAPSAHAVALSMVPAAMTAEATMARSAVADPAAVSHPPVDAGSAAPVPTATAPTPPGPPPAPARPLSVRQSAATGPLAAGSTPSSGAMAAPVPTPTPAVAVQSQPPAETSLAGSTSYSTGSNTIGVDPGVPNPDGGPQVDNGGVSVAPCPPPDHRSTAKALAGPVLQNPPGAVPTPLAGAVPSPTTTTTTTVAAGQIYNVTQA